jgi:hypothetical protein
MGVHIPRQLQLKQSGCSMGFSHVWTTYVSLAWTKIQPLTKLRTRRICCFDHNRKLSSQMGSECLWPLHNILLKKRNYVDKWYTLLLSEIILRELINKFTTFFYSVSYVKLAVTVYSFIGELLPNLNSSVSVILSKVVRDLSVPLHHLKVITFLLRKIHKMRHGRKNTIFYRYIYLWRSHSTIVERHAKLMNRRLRQERHESVTRYVNTCRVIMSV